ncbi:MAG: FecR domain-containing protein [Ignavibacteria bacterium]|jgi:ferric-dicitrate binding protein FerR (iron transport regulator)
MVNKVDMERLIRYCADESSLEEKKEVELWLEEDASNRKQYKFLRDIWKTSSGNIDWNTDSEWEKFSHNIEVVSNNEGNSLELINIKRETKTSKKFFERLLDILTGKYIVRYAVVLFVLVAGYSIFNYMGIFDSSALIERVTPFGKKAVVTLSDGSKVILNSGSRLRYPEEFSGSQRDIYLEGEAYFEVMYDKKRFTVHTAGVSTSVLGTKFNISAFPSEENIIVALIEGKVKITKKGPNNKESTKSIILTPNQQFTYNTNTDESSITEVNIQKAIGWKDNILVFENEPLNQVFKKLERAYGLEFKCEKKVLGNYNITTKFVNDSVWLVAEVIKKTTGLNYKTRKENNITKGFVFF